MGLFTSSASKAEQAKLKDDFLAASFDVERLTRELMETRDKNAQLSAELARWEIHDELKSMSPDSQQAKYGKLLSERDETINNLKKDIEGLNKEMTEQLTEHSKKMMAVLSEKEKQIKRMDALGAGATGNLRTAISAESEKDKGGRAQELKIIAKSDDQKKLITSSLIGNTFMKSLSGEQLQKLVDTMEPISYSKNEVIIKEHDQGNYMYILETGEVSITKGTGSKATHILDLTPGTLFGELAILYNCKRTATITAKTGVKLWQLSRNEFQLVVKSSGEEKDEEKYQLVRSVKDLSALSESKLRKICDCLDEEAYEMGDVIIMQGNRGDNLFIIKSGEVTVTKNIAKSKGGGTELLATLKQGEFFGEKALVSEDTRSANVIAHSANVICYTLDRYAFTNLIGTLDNNAKEAKKELDEPGVHQPVDTDTRVIPKQILDTNNVKDLKIIKPLGAGGFGLVKLVMVPGITDKPFALKCIQKVRVVEYGQQRHIMDEKNILQELQSIFILGLLKSYKDNKYVYLLTDAYLGGDLWRTLHARGPFNDTVGRFYIACVVTAFEYLHTRHYCYRDLKPENLMVDRNGYVRVVDLGFAKKVLPGHKTWTFCGTPEYICPEIIANTGHSICADLWSLGILVFELLSKRTPFKAKDDLAIYEGILRGIHSIQFPYKISRKAEAMIKALCRQDPSERIGYQKNGFDDIKKHRWFQGFDWEGLKSQKLVAPFTPEIKGVNDTNNFEKIRDDDPKKVPEETSGWDAEF